MANARAALSIVLATTLALLVWLWSVLPDPVASHFGAHGRADAWSSRDTLLAVLGATAVGDALLFLLLPVMIRRTPARSVALPHREYWVAPERRAATREALATRVTWLGVIVSCFLLVLTWEVGRANLAAGPGGAAALGAGFWAALVALALATGLWVRSLRARFHAPPPG